MRAVEAVQELVKKLRGESVINLQRHIMLTLQLFEQLHCGLTVNRQWLNRVVERLDIENRVQLSRLFLCVSRTARQQNQRYQT